MELAKKAISGCALRWKKQLVEIKAYLAKAAEKLLMVEGLVKKNETAREE